MLFHTEKVFKAPLDSIGFQILPDQTYFPDLDASHFHRQSLNHVKKYLDVSLKQEECYKHCWQIYIQVEPDVFYSILLYLHGGESKPIKYTG